MEEYPFDINEKRTVRRITFRQSLIDFLDAFNIERGLIYTLKSLITSPGNLVRDYLGTKRYSVVNPFRLLVLTTAASLLFMYLSGFKEVFYEMEQGFNKSDTFDFSQGELSDFFFDWYNLLLWAAIPIFALFSFWFNRRSGYNYTENLVLQSFFFSANNLFFVLVFPLNLTMDNGAVMFTIFVVGSIYYFYFLSSFFESRTFGFFLKNLISYLIAYLFYYVAISFTIAFYLLGF